MATEQTLLINTHTKDVDSLEPTFYTLEQVNEVEQRVIQQNSNNTETLGICLSGGGMRSTAFHLGVLRALKKMNMLKDVDYISSVAGGSQLASAYLTFLSSENDANNAADKLKERMRKRYAYLTGGTLATVHFYSSVVIGTLHNLLLLVTLAVLGSSFVFAGYRSITPLTGDYSLSGASNTTNGTDINQAVAEIHYNLFFYIFWYLGFYTLELDILHGEYRSSILRYEWVWAGAGFVAIIFITVAILLICCVHYNIFETKVENKGYHHFIAIIVQMLFFLCAIIVIPIIGIELLKIGIFALGLLYLKTHFNLAIIIAALSYGVASITTGLSVVKVLFSSIQVRIPVRIVLMVVGILAPLLFIMVAARMCIWYIFEHPINSTRTTSGALQSVELAAWIYFYIELCFSDLLNSAIHSMFRYRMKKSFFHDGLDKKLHDLPARPIFLCNATLNNFISRPLNRTYHPFLFSQLFMGSDVTGYRRTEDVDSEALLPSRVYTSFAASVSAAVISINQGKDDKKSSWPLRLTMQLFSINLGVYMRFSKMNIIFRFLRLFLVLDYSMLAAGLVLKFVCDYLQDDVIRGFKYLLWAIQIIMLFNIGSMILSLLGTAVFDNFRFDCPRWFPINMPVNDIPLFRSIPQVFGFRERKASRNIFLSDGGHFDELGLYQLLMRRTKKIIVFDSIGKSLTNLHHILLEAKTRNFIKRVEINGQEMDDLANIEQKEYHTKSNCLVFQVGYNDGTTGTVYYGKASITGEEKGMLKLQIVSDTKFPAASQTDHFLNMYNFDAYRRLGKHTALSVLNKL